ncbi:MAG: DUF1232 domain-containing protein [Clostridia bacterium]|nr:DUF1232 domain-containing protein [Clostridia bacterium]
MMSMKCEKCGIAVSASAGKYVYNKSRMVFACKSCAKSMTRDLKRTKMICAALDSKKAQAENIIGNRSTFDKFMEKVEATIQKIPDKEKSLLSDIPRLVSLAKDFVYGGEKDISCNSAVAAVAALLYVVSPFDIIPDWIPGIGFSDDAMVVAFCVNMLHGDLESGRERG